MYTLKLKKFSFFDGTDTLAFSGDVYLNGEKLGEIISDGMGGEIRLYATDRTLEKEARKYVDSLPEESLGEDDEWGDLSYKRILEDLLNEGAYYLSLGVDARKSGKLWLLDPKGEIWTVGFKSKKRVTLRWIKDNIDEIRESYPEHEILNLRYEFHF